MDKQQFNMANSKAESLNIEPKKSSYKLYVVDDWIKFRSKRGKKNNEVVSTYHPRTLTAHVLQDNPFYMLNLFHEYFGHGSFCEYSKIGQRIVNYESELNHLEKKILGGQEITERTIITRQNKHFKKYSALRVESEDYLIKKHEIYEGFAYWFEMYLSEDKGKRLINDEIIYSLYSDLIAKCDDFVKNNGVKNFIEFIFTKE